MSFSPSVHFLVIFLYFLLGIIDLYPLNLIISRILLLSYALSAIIYFSVFDSFIGILFITLGAIFASCLFPFVILTSLGIPFLSTIVVIFLPIFSVPYLFGINQLSNDNSFRFLLFVPFFKYSFKSGQKYEQSSYFFRLVFLNKFVLNNFS